METERLLLVPWSHEYADEFARVCADPEAMRFISGGGALSRAIDRPTSREPRAARGPGKP